MNILALADRPPHLSLQGSIADYCHREGVDIICTLGDLEMADIAELEYITDVPKIGVYGNHCSGSYMEPLGIVNMHMRTAQLNGISFGGFEGAVRYKQGDAPMFTQAEATALMSDFPYVDIFLSHAPPYGINDEPDELAHQGFHGLRQYLDGKQPKLWLHGHTYPSPDALVTTVGSTRIEYVFGHKLITF
ncbi:MAG TPA: hypothetical protein VFN56_05550 [Candidatus Saccharimonadales bacterium]|nr:hypothetical protein [Candidatus Saccharimonadales bacterium]